MRVFLNEFTAQSWGRVDITVDLKLRPWSVPWKSCWLLSYLWVYIGWLSVRWKSRLFSGGYLWGHLGRNLRVVTVVIHSDQIRRRRHQFLRFKQIPFLVARLWVLHFLRLHVSVEALAQIARRRFQRWAQDFGWHIQSQEVFVERLSRVLRAHHLVLFVVSVERECVISLLAANDQVKFLLLLKVVVKLIQLYRIYHFHSGLFLVGLNWLFLAQEFWNLNVSLLTLLLFARPFSHSGILFIELKLQLLNL